MEFEFGEYLIYFEFPLPAWVYPAIGVVLLAALAAVWVWAMRRPRDRQGHATHSDGL